MQTYVLLVLKAVEISGGNYAKHNKTNEKN